MPGDDDVKPQQTANTTTNTTTQKNNTDVLKKQDLQDPLLSTRTNTSINTGVNTSGGNDMPGGGDPMAERVAGWMPSITKVTDPVAFMTSAALNTKGRVDGGAGNYDQAIYDPKSAKGFYEQAKAECLRISQEIRQFQATPDLGGTRIMQLEMMASFLSSYAELYAAIQTSGSGSGDAKKQQAITANVRGQLIKAQGFYAGIQAELLGPGAARIENAMKEIAIFVESWNVVANQAANTNASSQMGALFLQTNERSRQILNEYGQLDDRGGDTTGTAKMAVMDKKGYFAHTPEEGTKAIAEGGGVMAQALRSYGLAAGNNEAMTVQVKEVVARVQAGEFKSEAECVAAFRKHVGGGRASEAFYKQLEQVARGHWKSFLARTEANLQQQSNIDAAQSQTNAKSHIDEAEQSIQTRDMNAKSIEKNSAYYGMTAEDYQKLGEEARSGTREVVNKKLDPRKQEQNHNPAFDFKNPNAEYDEFGNITRLVGQDTAIVVNHGPSDEQLIELGKATMSDQEHSYLKMDEKSTQAAYDNAMAAQQQAKIATQLAKKEVAAGEQFLQQGLGHYLQAQKYITEARAHAAYVSSKNPAIQSGLASLESELKAIEAKLAQDAEIRGQLQKAQTDLEGILAKHTKNLDTYNPEQLKVPMPEVVIDGRRLETESYQKLTVDLSGPAWGVFWWLGGLEGSYSTISSTKEADNNWKKAKIEIYAGIKADLWIIEAGVKLKGFFEAQKKNADGLIDTLYAGGEELGRWAYAWWYDLSAMSGRIGAAIDRSLSQGGNVYDMLLTASADGDLVGAELELAEAKMGEIHRMLGMQLGGAFGRSEMDPAEGVKMAAEVLPLEDVVEGIHALSGLKEQAPEQVKAEKQGFLQTGGDAKREAMGEVAKVDPGKNNPDVKFEAGVGIEGFVGVKFGSENKASLGVTRVYSIKDGDGESFDYFEDKKTNIKLSVEIKGGWGIEISLSPKGDGWKGGIEIAIPIDSAESVEGSQALGMMRKAVTGVRGKDVSTWAKAAQAELEKIDWKKYLKTDTKVKPQEYLKAKVGASIKVKIGAELTLNKDWDITASSYSFALVHKLEAGDNMAKIGYEQGNIASLKSGD